MADQGGRSCGKYSQPDVGSPPEDGKYATHGLRETIRLAIERGPHPTAVKMDGRTLQSTPERGGHEGFDGYKRNKVPRFMSRSTF